MNGVLSTMLSPFPRCVVGWGNRRCRKPPLSQRNANACGSQRCLLRATAHQPAVDHNSGNGSDAKLPRHFRYKRVLHVFNRYVARRTCNPLDESDRVLTATTPGTENFDFPLLLHTIMISLDALHRFEPCLECNSDTRLFPYGEAKHSRGMRLRVDPRRRT